MTLNQQASRRNRRADSNGDDIELGNRRASKPGRDNEGSPTGNKHHTSIYV